MRLEKNNVCHKSMSHDSSEPNFIIDEKSTKESFEHILEEAIESIEHPETATQNKQTEQTEEKTENKDQTE